ncbi:porin family protein [Oceanihabitans sediminis]|uniref:PorT family protein n=1 Tax=Oceanihabitans sediminis TaxID=1812012 RepID=A0A368P240_9FLAO|nr:porin family protein [Oceanihabitans sediminis]MDX1277433.1 porin family protein [Oceanihabitans sediminis]MDX1774230.1 porin family protein [Oceanihabitans sediminis]RCU56937.1 PorT family protein [Oceanihabitans sediminis]
MKNTLITSLLVFAFIFHANAQQGNGFGIKGGLNYNGNGKYFESISANAENPDKNVGFHVGVFGKVGKTIFFKPELVYTKTKSEYDQNDFVMQKLDAPLLVGVNVLKVFNVFGGPSLQYILDSEFDGVTIDDVEKDFTVGLNFGIGVNINKIGIDLRYERGFDDNEATFVNENGLDASRIDTRPEQLILSISLLL